MERPAPVKHFSQVELARRCSISPRTLERWRWIGQSPGEGFKRGFVLSVLSRKDAERYGVSEDDRHPYVRLDDAKANVGLVTNKARWCRRVGVTIANGDEVGVLVPEELEPVAGDDKDAGDLHRTIIACLLARVSDREITLNAAAKLLAWSGDERFAKFRETDGRGKQRASRPFRVAILDACRRGTYVVNGGASRGFTCDEMRKPVTLKRFEMPASAAEIASQDPEFMEDL